MAKQAMMITPSELQDIKAHAYDKGFEDGLTTYAHWKDGEQYVGTTGTKLKDAQRSRHTAWNYAPYRVGDSNE